MSDRYGRGAKPPAPDPRDFIFEPHIAGAALPESVDLRSGAVPPTPDRPVGPVRDQGQEGSCVGHAASELAEALWMVRNGVFVRLSPAFTYYETRLKEKTQNQDAGADPRDALAVMRSKGACPEADDPYVVGQYAQAPPKQAVTDARQYRIGAYHGCPTPLLVKAALAQRQPVLITIGASDSFENTGLDGIVPQASLDDQHDWDHENIIVGYTPTWWLCQNSWGTAWGAQGYYYVPIARFDYFYWPATATLRPQEA